MDRKQWVITFFSKKNGILYGIMKGYQMEPTLPGGELPELEEQVLVLTRVTNRLTASLPPAAHHRLLWVHPFVDGNGRVARLMSHAMLLRSALGNPLWSVSRGLARQVAQYKASLAAADQGRYGDFDGRGNLSQRALVDFCRFFFAACIQQVEFMESLLKPGELGRRIRLYVRDEVDGGRLPKGSEAVLLEAFTTGEVERGKLPELTGYQERRARQILAELLQRELLVSTGPRRPVRLGFPLHIAERWLPSLYV